MVPNWIYTDPEVRITIDIDDAENEALISCHAVALNFYWQYNN